MSDCLFCKFATEEIKVNKVFEDDNMIIINDINPMAKIHYLAIPKKHFVNTINISKEDSLILAKCISTIGNNLNKLKLDNGYRLIINNGSDSGQCVFHLHIHILAGEKLADIIAKPTI